MFNVELFLGFSLYFLSLAVGFSLMKSRKNSFDKKYYKFFKYPLLCLIFFIFGFSVFIFNEVYLVLDWFKFVLILNLFFIIYFCLFVWISTRCWKQHRIIVYNFLMILLVYFSSLVLNSFEYYFWFVGLVCFYSVFEFLFAKFSFKQKIFWD